MSLSKLLSEYRGKSLFLPAHGRGKALPKEFKKLLQTRAGIWDLPEIPEVGGPLLPHGAVANSQKKSAAEMGAERAWYGVNGATGLLQAALLAMARPGQAVLMPRNVHRSVIAACVLGDLTPVIYDLPFLTDRGHVLPPDGPWLKKILDSFPSNQIDVAAAVLIHPSYQGYANNLRPLINLLHEYGLSVLVDEAHGTHFASRVDKDLPESALSAGADLIVHSLHKSSIGLVQSAVLWLQGHRIDPYLVERSMGWVQTTSPSALLLASCEAALLEWRTPVGRRRLKARIDEARDVSIKLCDMGLPLLENQDPLRLILHTASHGISGIDADKWFQARGLIAELPEPGCLTFCMGFASQRGLIRRFSSLWKELTDIYYGNESLEPFSAPPIPLISIPSLNPGCAWRAPFEKVQLRKAVGRISADLICPYPPGIPLLFPGEEVDRGRVNWLLDQKGLWPDQISNELRVVA